VGLEARIAELAGTVRALLAGLARVEREVAALGLGLVAAEVQLGALERARVSMMAMLKRHMERADALQAQVDALQAAGAVVARTMDEVRVRCRGAGFERAGTLEGLQRVFDGEGDDDEADTGVK
jgi:hypothetical protein